MFEPRYVARSLGIGSKLLRAPDTKKILQSRALIASLLGIICFQFLERIFSQSRPPSPDLQSLSSPTLLSTSGLKFVEQLLFQADEDYQRNIARRRSMPEYAGCIANKTTCTGLMVRMMFIYPFYPCLREMGVGKVGEGGKWICNIPGLLRNESSIVYSIGSRGDISFETEMHMLFGFTSFTFDPTLSPGRQTEVNTSSFVNFYNIGLSGAEDMEKAKRDFKGRLAPGAKMMRIDDIMAMLNHTYVDVFKIDCEGCEVEVMRGLLQASRRETPRFGQVLMEMHCVREADVALELLLTMENLGYRPFHVEQNFVSGGAYELAYIHESLVSPHKD